MAENSGKSGKFLGIWNFKTNGEKKMGLFRPFKKHVEKRQQARNDRLNGEQGIKIGGEYPKSIVIQLDNLALVTGKKRIDLLVAAAEEYLKINKIDNSYNAKRDQFFKKMRIEK